MSVLEVVEKFPCGYNKKDSAVATLYNNGELIVRGEGDMMNYTFELPPWFKLRKKNKIRHYNERNKKNWEFSFFTTP